MNSKEFLKKLINDIEEKNEIVSKEPHLIINIKVNAETFIPLLHNIKQDLDRLEQLEKALDKACERLEWTCPVDQELVEDLDCDECDNNCKECWKKYFMKEVLKDE